MSLPTFVLLALLHRDGADMICEQTMRPPYGDIDDRVRYISLQMGLTVCSCPFSQRDARLTLLTQPIIWTAYQANTFDTRDWQITAGVVNSTSVYMNFERFLTTAITTLPNGFVVLAHDLYQQSVRRRSRECEFLTDLCFRSISLSTTFSRASSTPERSSCNRSSAVSEWISPRRTSKPPPTPPSSRKRPPRSSERRE